MNGTSSRRSAGDDGHAALTERVRGVLARELGRVPLAALVALRRALPENARATLERSEGSTLFVVTTGASAEERASWRSLTPREREVARAIGLGLSNKEIAARLGIGEGTVKDHVHHVLQKLARPGASASRAAIASLARAANHDPTMPEPHAPGHPSNDGPATKRVARRPKR